MSRIQRRSILIALCPLLISAATAHASQREGRLLKKSWDAMVTSSAKAAQVSITIRVDGLQQSDLVNIRPATSRVSATAGTLTKSARLQGVMASEPIAPGESLDESALAVTPNLVTF